MYAKQVQLFMIFDRLADTVRTGPVLWQVKRERLEDVKDHILDLLLIARLLESEIAPFCDMNKIFDYIICHDLPEAITGDITIYEGVSPEEIERVTRLAQEYLVEYFGDIIDFKTIFNAYENREDLEAKVVKMIDSIHSATTFIKYEAEEHIDYDDPNIIPVLRNTPVVTEGIAIGDNVDDIFYKVHLKKVTFTDEEKRKYGITDEVAAALTKAISGFATELYNQKRDKKLFAVYKKLPVDAMLYKH